MLKDTQSSALFEGIFLKPIISRFDSKLRTSDGGASLLGVIDRRTNLTQELCGHLVDERASSQVRHTYLDLFRQRVFSIALGYPDGNDSARIGADPAMKLLCGRGSSDSQTLASQPTLSRFEYGSSPTASAASTASPAALTY